MSGVPLNQLDQIGPTGAQARTRKPRPQKHKKTKRKQKEIKIKIKRRRPKKEKKKNGTENAARSGAGVEHPDWLRRGVLDDADDADDLLLHRHDGARGPQGAGVSAAATIQPPARREHERPRRRVRDLLRRVRPRILPAVPPVRPRVPLAVPHTVDRQERDVPIVPTTVHRTRTAIAKSSTAEYARTVTHTRIAAAHALKSGSRVTHASHICGKRGVLGGSTTLFLFH